MLDDKSLTRLCVILAVAGLVVLTLSVHFLQPAEASTGEIDETYVGRIVKVSGEAVSVRNAGDIFIELDDGTGTTNIVIFERGAKNMVAAKQGDFLAVTGKVSVYRGSVEIIASEVGLIEPA